jgi:signal transduction histidine kinase
MAVSFRYLLSKRNHRYSLDLWTKTLAIHIASIQNMPGNDLAVAQYNGHGFRPPRKFARLAAKGELGLIGIQQRIDFLGRTFEVRSKLGEGTSLLIEAKC